MGSITIAEIIARAQEQQKKIIAEMSDRSALIFRMAYPAWAVGAQYMAGERIRHNDMLYRVLADHTAAADHESDRDAEIYALVTITEE